MAVTQKPNHQISSSKGNRVVMSIYIQIQTDYLKKKNHHDSVLPSEGERDAKGFIREVTWQPLR